MTFLWYVSLSKCPSCGSYVEREDLSNLCVRCTICTSVKNNTFQFCWQCMREWKGAGLRCSYEDCVNPDVDKLAKCTNMRLSYVNNVECPAIRACPTCGLLLEHNGLACKNLMCKRCKVEFCFLCLKLKLVCNPISGPYNVCSVVPRQTEIPVWKR